MQQKKRSVELVIPSYNRLSILESTLNKIRMIYPELPICIGLQGDRPDGKFLLWLEQDAHLRILSEEKPSTTVTLNHCIATSKADIILLLDDDAIPSVGWLDAHLEAFEKNSALAYTCGREVRVSYKNPGISKVLRAIVQKMLGVFFSPTKKLQGYVVGWLTRSGLLLGNFDLPGECVINSPRGCNMGIRKAPFLELGGFNENFRGNAWGFEADFGLRLQRQDQLGKYIGSAIVHHLEVSSGGSRQKSSQKWFDDFMFNQRLLIERLGKTAWIGSLPRLIKFYIKMIHK
ncbi:MAG: glycosyltransferase [bacterium]|nr:MAG: glycosyltransferase [bacterium]